MTNLREEIAKDLYHRMTGPNSEYPNWEYLFNKGPWLESADHILSPQFLQKLIDGGAVGVDQDQMFYLLNEYPEEIPEWEKLDRIAGYIAASAAKVIKPREPK